MNGKQTKWVFGQSNTTLVSSQSATGGVCAQTQDKGKKKRGAKDGKSGSCQFKDYQGKETSEGSAAPSPLDRGLFNGIYWEGCRRDRKRQRQRQC